MLFNNLPNSVFDIHKSLSTRRVEEYEQLVDCPIITRCKLEHGLNAVRWHWAHVCEHALDELEAQNSVFYICGCRACELTDPPEDSDLLCLLLPSGSSRRGVGFVVPIRN